MGKVAAWRKNMDYSTLLLALILFQFVVSVAMLVLGHLTGKAYFRGVGVGLLIAWATSAIAYLVIRRAKRS